MPITMYQAMYYSMEMLTLQTINQRMDPNHCLRGLNTKDTWSNIYLLKMKIKNLHFSFAGGSENIPYLLQWVKLCIIQWRCYTSNSHQGMDPNHCLTGLNTKDREVQHISFENISKKSAHFSFVEVQTYIFLKDIQVNLHFSHFRGVCEHTIPISMCEVMSYPMEMSTLQTLTEEWTQITVLKV